VSESFVDIGAEQLVMHFAGVVGLAILLLLSSCAGPIPPSNAPSQGSPPQAGAEAVPPVVPQPPLPSALSPTVATQAGIAAGEPASGSATMSAAAPTGQTAGGSAPLVAKAPATIPATPAPAAQPSKKENIPPDIAKPKVPPLDLASLEQRLKDTKAIGVLTKITLKNQVDDLLDQFRAFYRGKLKTDLASLRRSYDLLVLKVLSLLQESDQALATAIVASREAIWGILSDPAKFATI
jgi:hypothetical protein